MTNFKEDQIDMDNILSQHVNGFVHMLGAGGETDDHHKVQYFT